MMREGKRGLERAREGKRGQERAKEGKRGQKRVRSNTTGPVPAAHTTDACRYVML
jgi:hypothetical protein